MKCGVRSLEVRAGRVAALVLDDGTTTRLSPTRYFMTTTTAQAAMRMVPSAGGAIRFLPPGSNRREGVA